MLRHGTLLHAAGYGDATPQTLYQSASLGKHFLASLALVLSPETLDLPIAPRLPELPPSYASITLRQLLSHTAGIPDAGYNSLDFARDYTDPEIIYAISQPAPPDFEPGASFRYSNAGYVLAGIAISRGTGAFYGDLLRDYVFTPTAMNTAQVNTAAAPIGYIREGPAIVPAAYVSPTLNRLADGGLTLSVLDFARWETALSSDWGSRVAGMFRETPLADGSPSGYGLGWFLSTNEHGRIAEHDGAWQGFSTAMVRYLDAGASTIVLANLEDVDAAGLAHALVRACPGT